MSTVLEHLLKAPKRTLPTGEQSPAPARKAVPCARKGFSMQVRKAKLAMCGGLWALSSVAGLCAPAWAQVVTPPPAEVAPVDEHIDKMPVPPPRPEAQVQPVQAQPVAARQPIQLPDLPYEPLAQKDDAGNFKPLSEPLQMAALRANPTIDNKAKFFEDIKPFLAERNLTVHTVFVSNLDLLERVDDGVFEKVNLRDQASIKQLLEVTKPFLPPAAPDGLLEGLKKAGKLNDVQHAFAAKFARDYTLTLNPPPPEGGEEGEKARISMARAAQLLKNGSLEEYTFLYNQAKKASIENFDSVLGLMENLDESKKADVARIREAVKAAGTPEDKLAAFRGLRDVLTLEQRKEWMKHCLIMIPQ
jgi:hypothetical protein